MANTLLYGGYAEVADVLMVRDLTPCENYIKSIEHVNRTTLTRIFPLAPMTWWMLRMPGMPRTLETLTALLNLNKEFHVAYMAYYHPIYTRLTRPFWKALPKRRVGDLYVEKDC